MDIGLLETSRSLDEVEEIGDTVPFQLQSLYLA